jgi:hypothetical protein
MTERAPRHVGRRLSALAFASLLAGGCVSGSDPGRDDESSSRPADDRSFVFDELRAVDICPAVEEVPSMSDGDTYTTQLAPLEAARPYRCQYGVAPDLTEREWPGEDFPLVEFEFAKGNDETEPDLSAPAESLPFEGGWEVVSWNDPAGSMYNVACLAEDLITMRTIDPSCESEPPEGLAIEGIDLVAANQDIELRISVQYYGFSPATNHKAAILEIFSQLIPAIQANFPHDCSSFMKENSDTYVCTDHE